MWNDRITGTWRGSVAFYIQSNIRFSTVNMGEASNASIEQMWITFKTQGIEVAIGVVYRK